MSYSGTLIQRWALGLATYVHHNEISSCRVFSVDFTITGARNMLRYTEDFLTNKENCNLKLCMSFV